MGLIGKIFGNGGKEREGGVGPASTQFRESEPDSGDSQASRNAPRRELVQVVLRDTMRKHGIPSDWIESRMLSTVSRSGRHGLHVNFVVKQAHDRLLAYVFAFQDSFERELTRYEPRARDWLVSIGWEFVGFNAEDMPDPRTWAQSGPMPLQPAAPLVNADWTAPQPSGFDALQDLQAAPTPTAKADHDLQDDLKALFAIRDEALKQARPGRDTPDFENTQPYQDDEPPTRR